jgi:hypothetical protein
MGLALDEFASIALSTGIVVARKLDLGTGYMPISCQIGGLVSMT